MVVIASRQTGPRPETIRTRLARFMPSRAAGGWSIAWSTHTERPAEIGNEAELCAAEHLGCYGAAVAHALAQAEVAPVRLRITAVASPAVDGDSQPITVEVRAQIPGPELDPTIFEIIARRADPACPAWQDLVASPGVRVYAILDSENDEPTPSAESTKPRPGTPLPAHQPSGRRLALTWIVASFQPLQLARPTSLPKWLTPRFGVLLAVAFGAFAVAPHPWLS